MSKILNCKSVTTTTKNKEKKPMILVQTAERDIWITIPQWKSKGLSNSLESYTGGNIDARFFDEGEELFNGTACTESDKILADFSCSANPAVLAHAIVVENAAAMEVAVGASALFARARAERLAKQEAAKAKTQDTVLDGGK